MDRLRTLVARKVVTQTCGEQEMEPDPSLVKMEAECSSETSINY
jgi:hypothetical protein